MKKFFLLLLILMFAFNFAACSDDDDNPPPATQTDDDDDDDDDGPLAGYTATDITYDGSTVKGYSLDQFVTGTTVNTIFDNPTLYTGGTTPTTTPVDCRKLYIYRVIAADSWNPYDNKGGADLTWDLYTGGYLLEKLYDARVYFPSDMIVAYYDVKNAAKINMYRVINVIKDADGTPVTIPFEMSALTAVDLTYWNTSRTVVLDGKGVSLADLLSDYVIDESVDKATYNYIVNCADEYIADGTSGTLLNNTLTWSLLQETYYIFEEDGEAKDKIIILGTDYTGSDDGGPTVTEPRQAYKSIKIPESIEFADGGAGDDNPIGDDDVTATAPAQVPTANPDLQFAFPEQ